MKLSTALHATLLAAALVPAASAYAQEDFSGSAGVGHASRFPVQYVDRPLVMPTRMLGLSLGLGAAHFSVDTGLGGTVSDTSWALAGSGQYGLLDNLEVGALVLPLQLSPDVKYGNPNVYGIYRFLDQGGLEVGAMLQLDLGVRSGSNTGVMVGLPVAYHFGHLARLDTGVFLGVEFGDETMTMPSIPLRLHFQAMNELALGVNTGLYIPTQEHANAYLPLSVDAIYSIPKGSMPLADVGVQFGFPVFLVPGSEGDKVTTDLWTLTVFGTYYMDL